MITDAYIAIDRIVKNKDVSFAMVTLELYDQIFQKSWTRRERKALFIFAMVRLDQYIFEQMHVHDHLFTAFIDDTKEVMVMSQEDAISLSLNFLARKAAYQGNILRALLSIFSIFELQAYSDRKYLLFTLLMRSGFIPFNQNHGIYINGAYNEELALRAILQLEAMCWICAGDEHSFTHYSLNVINGLREFPVSQQVVQLKFAALMKGRGYVEGINDVNNSLPKEQNQYPEAFGFKLARSLQK